MKNTKNTPWRIIGLMSGTSMDSIDAVMVEIDRDNEVLKLKKLAEHAITCQFGLVTALFQRISSQDYATSLVEMCGLHFFMWGRRSRGQLISC